MKYVVVAVMSLAITACATPEQIAARNAAYTQAIQDQCRAYGFQPGSDAFAGCVQRTHENVQGAAARRDAAFYCNQGVAQACAELGVVMPQQRPQMPRTTDCYTNRSGYTQCTTY